MRANGPFEPPHEYPDPGDREDIRYPRVASVSTVRDTLTRVWVKKGWSAYNLFSGDPKGNAYS
jgi:hypothetical protein